MQILIVCHWCIDSIFIHLLLPVIKSVSKNIGFKSSTSILWEFILPLYKSEIAGKNHEQFRNNFEKNILRFFQR